MERFLPHEGGVHSFDRYQTPEEVGWAVKKHIHFCHGPAHPFRHRRHVAQPGRATLFETGLTGCPNLLDHYSDAGLGLFLSSRLIGGFC